MFLLTLALSLAGGVDADRDGLDDAYEQQILERFLPAFHVSPNDCDTLPSEFAPGSLEPKVVAKNGTIYGQVFRTDAGIEVHYYHLWGRDCGRRSHPLDVESVSALLAADGSKAIQWQAAAHEGTVCDQSHGAMAAALDAEDRGPKVWISRDKHASYLSLPACAGGCAVDRCDKLQPLKFRRVVNLGESGAPLNDSIWIASDRWGLNTKMTSRFSPDVRAQIGAGTAIAPVHRSPVRVQAAIAGGTVALDGISTGNRHTEEAMSTAERHTDRALGTASRSVGRSLRRASKATARWLGL